MIKALILGVIQGLSEFLPISSSGHLALAMHFFDWQDPPLVMSLVVHLGTLGAVFVVYGKDLWLAFKGGLRLFVSLFQGRAKEVFKEDPFAGLALWIVVATFATGIVALLIRDVVKEVTESPQVVGGLLTFCGLILLSSRFIPVRDKPLNFPRTFLIGLVQGLAVFPGLSRSGTTIVVAMAAGLNRSEAARFSFVASVPAIIGASILELDFEVIATSSSGVGAYILAGLTSLVVGYLALRVLVGLVRRGKLWWFAFYMIPVGILALLFIR